MPLPPSLLCRRRSFAGLIVLCLLSFLVFFTGLSEQAQGYPGGGGGGGYPGGGVAYWSGPSYSVHEVDHAHGSMANSDSDTTATTTSNPSGGAGAYNSSGTVTESTTVTITATWQWQVNGTTTPPPATVPILESPSASWWANSSSVSVSSQAVNDGMNDPPVANLPNSSTLSETASGNHVMQADGHTGTLTVTRTLSANLTLSGSCASSVSYSYQASVFTATLQAHSTVDTANWDPTHPRFFSGTYCNAIVNAVPISGYVSRVQLLIDAGGQLGSGIVNEYDDAGASRLSTDSTTIFSTGTHQSNVSIWSYFDTTALWMPPDGSPLPVTMKVWDTAGNYYDAQLSANVYNKAYVLGNNVGDLQTYGAQAVSNVASAIEDPQFTTNSGISDYASTITQNLPLNTIFFISTHGNVELFDDCYANPNPSSPVSDRIFAYTTSPAYSSGTTVNQAISAKSVNQPPYTFVYIHACSVLANQDIGMATAFGFSGLPDTAFLGWTTEIAISAQTNSFINQLWTDLARGMPLGQALADAKQQFPPQFVDKTTGVENPAVFEVYGDSNTVVEGAVYGGSPGQWHR